MLFEAYPEEQVELRWVTVTLATIATVLLLCRLLATIKNRGWLGLEDALVAVANVFLIVSAVMIYKSTVYGFGTRAADISRDGGDITKAMKVIQTPTHVVNWHTSSDFGKQFFWLSQLFYVLTNGFNKMAFVALYYRIFALPWFGRACMVLMSVSIGWMVSYSFVVLFQCTPMVRVYDRTIPGTCIDGAWHHWTNAILNLVTDLAIFILPIPVLLRLNMSIGSRIGLIMLFCMGFFICLTTALRMVTLPLFLRSTDPSWEAAPTNLWSFVESAVGIICSGLISLRQVIDAVWPKKWRICKGTSSVQYPRSNSDGPSRNHPGSSRPRDGAGHAGGYHMSGLVSAKRGVREIQVSIRSTESQEQIIDDTKTEGHVRTSMAEHKSVSGSDEIHIQGIKTAANMV